MSATISVRGTKSDAYLAGIMKRAQAVADPIVAQIVEDAKANATGSASGGEHLASTIEAPVLTAEPNRLTYEIWCRAPYAAAHEFGRAKGSLPPPWRAMLSWVSTIFGVSGKEATSAAIATAKNIGKFGYGPTFFMSSAAWNAERPLGEGLEKEFER